MGLDMYLTKTTYVGFQYEHNRRKDGSVPMMTSHNIEHIQPERVSEITETVGTWRKANAIHAWFIANCADGMDDCQDVQVTEDHMNELLRVCNLVLSLADIEKGIIKNGKVGTANGWEDILQPGEYVSNAEVVARLLPPQSGFFFGGTDYDQYYIHDIKLTVEILTEALKDTDKHYTEFHYRASW